MDRIEKVRKTAIELFGGEAKFFCSEAVAWALCHEFNIKNKDVLVSACTGFAVGIGREKCLCGAIAGGVIVLSHLFGRTTPGEEGSKKCLDLTGELLQRFHKNHKVSCCKVLTKPYENDPKGHSKNCKMLTGDIAAWTAEIIIRENKKKSL